jgi:hypothetical protein
MNLFLLNSMEH